MAAGSSDSWEWFPALQISDDLPGSGYGCGHNFPGLQIAKSDHITDTPGFDRFSIFQRYADMLTNLGELDGHVKVESLLYLE